MLGILVNTREMKELEYVIKRELEEILLDMGDQRIDRVIKDAMDERYRILFRLFQRVAPQNECVKYIPKKR